MKNKNLSKKVVFITILLSLAVLAAPSQTAPRQEKLLNGLKLLMWSDPAADKVSVKIRIHSGSAFDPQGREGVMQMLSDNIFPNAAAREFFTEDLGGGLEIMTTYDYIQINASCSTSKPENFLTMLETLASAVANPTIDKETTAKLQTALLEKVKVMESDPAYVVDRAIAKRLLGTFPYGRPLLGSPESVARIGYPDLIDAKQRFLTADNATVTISGNFDKALGFKAARRYFGNWLKSDKKTLSTFRQPDDAPAGMLTVSSPKPGVSAIRFALRGTSRGGADFAASQVFTSILDTRLKARVPAEHKNDIFVRNEARTLPGIIIIGFAADKKEIGTGNGKIDASELISKAMSDRVADAEFQVARSAVAGEWIKRSPQWFWLDADTYKILSVEADRAAFDKVTLADVQAYAGKIQKSSMASVLLTTPAK